MEIWITIVHAAGGVLYLIAAVLTLIGVIASRQGGNNR